MCKKELSCKSQLAKKAVNAMRDRLQQKLSSVAEKEQLALLNLTNSGSSLLTMESSLSKEEV